MRQKTLKIGWPLISNVYIDVDQIIAKSYPFTTWDDFERILQDIVEFLDTNPTPDLPEDFEQNFSEVLVNAMKATEEEKYVQLFIFPDGVLLGVDNKAKEGDLDRMTATLPEPKKLNGTWVLQDGGRGLYLLAQSCSSIVVLQHEEDLTIYIGYGE